MEAWRVFITPAADRVVKKLPAEARKFVENEFPSLIRQNPLAGFALASPLDWLRSFHFSADGKPYRIAYAIDTKTHKIYIHYADYRGHFYKNLRNILRK